MARSVSLLLLLAALLAAGPVSAELDCEAALEPLQEPNPKVRLQTSLGDIVIELDSARAPLTAANFMRYVTAGYYDGSVFHRIVPDFVVQGGGYDGEYQQLSHCPPVVNESGNGLANARGTVAMARMGAPHTGNSQFYINLKDNPALNPQPARWGYAVFGRVVEGMDVVDSMAAVETGVGSALPVPDVPLEPVVLNQAAVVTD